MMLHTKVRASLIRFVFTPCRDRLIAPDLDVDLVLDCTGVLTQADGQEHIKAGVVLFHTLELMILILRLFGVNHHTLKQNIEWSLMFLHHQLYRSDYQSLG